MTLHFLHEFRTHRTAIDGRFAGIGLHGACIIGSDAYRSTYNLLMIQAFGGVFPAPG